MTEENTKPDINGPTIFACQQSASPCASDTSQIALQFDFLQNMRNLQRLKLDIKEIYLTLNSSGQYWYT